MEFVNTGSGRLAIEGAPVGARGQSGAAAVLSAWYVELVPQLASESGTSMRYLVPVYEGDVPEVRSAAAHLRATVIEDLVGAYVHGSMADGETTGYSDFDALAIVSDSVMREPARLDRVAAILRRAQAFLFRADPLQHHGWFVQTEADLGALCSADFPPELFGFSRSLLGGRGTRLDVRGRHSEKEAAEALRSIGHGVKRHFGAGVPPVNLYDLKNGLSLLMLLPAVYLQVRDGRGVYKKQSFEVARPDFASDWECMEVASAIRREWVVSLAPWRRRILGVPWRGRRRLVRLLAPPIQEWLRKSLPSEVCHSMVRLAGRMLERAGVGNL